MKANIIDTDTALAELPTPPTELPCGCCVPFRLCPVAERLLNAEWEAGNAMLRVANLPGATADDYAAVRATWRAAVHAYDAHRTGTVGNG